MSKGRGLGGRVARRLVRQSSRPARGSLRSRLDTINEVRVTYPFGPYRVFQRYAPVTPSCTYAFHVCTQIKRLTASWARRTFHLFVFYTDRQLVVSPWTVFLPNRFNQVQHRLRLMAPSCQDLPPTVPLSIFSPVTVPLPPKPPAAGAAAPASSAPKTAPAGGGGVGAKPSDGGGAATAGGGGKKDKKKKNKGGEGGGGAKKGAAAGAAAAPGATKKGAEPAAAAAAAPAVEGEPSKLDVRVGVIVKAWEHPESEKLFCEEIDLGEASF